MVKLVGIWHPFNFTEQDGLVSTASYVWDSETLAWIKARQADVDVASLSDSTAANQVAGNASLSSIDTKLSSQATDAKQDYANFESQYVTLSSGTDTTITFSQSVRMVRVTNWDAVNVVLVKNGTISTDTDATASRVGIAPATNVPGGEVFPIVTSTIHIRSAGASVVTVEGFC